MKTNPQRRLMIDSLIATYRHALERELMDELSNLATMAEDLTDNGLTKLISTLPNVYDHTQTGSKHARKVYRLIADIADPHNPEHDEDTEEDDKQPSPTYDVMRLESNLIAVVEDIAKSNSLDLWNVDPDQDNVSFHATGQGKAFRDLPTKLSLGMFAWKYADDMQRMEINRLRYEIASVGKNGGQADGDGLTTAIDPDPIDL